MTLDKFKEIKAQIKQNFEILDEYEEELDPGLAEVLEFVGPSGKMKVSFSTKPKLLDTKTMYSNRAGSNVRVDKVYSEEEEVSFLDVFVFDQDSSDWKKLDTQSLF